MNAGYNVAPPSTNTLIEYPTSPTPIEIPMKCQACGTDLGPEAAFCQSCGAKVGGGATPAKQPANAADSGRGFVGSARRDDPEVELWTGGYSAKAMYNSYLVATVLSVTLVIGGIVFLPALYFCLGGVVLVWLWVIATLIYRRMNIYYRLTSQRFFHQTGVLTRTTNRIEVIQMDDVTFSQSLLERLVGVGTIKITSSDATHPELIMSGIDHVAEVSEIIDKARRKELTRRGLRIETV